MYFFEDCGICFFDEVVDVVIMYVYLDYGIVL